MKRITTLSLLGLLGFSLCSNAAESPEMVTKTAVRGHTASPLNAGLDLQFTPISFPDYDWVGGIHSNQIGHGFHIAGEWIPVNQVFGKIGIGVGTGFTWIKRTALNSRYAGTLYTLPMEAFLSYRLDVFENQILVPFAKLGTNATLISQYLRVHNEGDRNTWKTYYGVDYSLGAEFNMNVIDQQAARDLDNLTGINGTYITFEYVKSRRLAGRLDANLTHEEYRLGMRFEM